MDLGTTLTRTAAAVAAVAGCQADVDALDEGALFAGMALIRDHKHAFEAIELLFATTIARRSDHTLGFAGLARKNGAATPTILIQSLTGSSLDEARTLANLGQLMVDAEADPQGNPLVEALTGGLPGVGLPGEDLPGEGLPGGGLSLESAEAIRAGLGSPDEAVTAGQLAEATAELMAGAGGVSPEVLRRMATQARTDLDVAAVERGEKHRAALRTVRHWRRDGFSHGRWRIPLEDGGIEIDTALTLLLSNHRGGPRFPTAPQHATRQQDAGGDSAGPDAGEAGADVDTPTTTSTAASIPVLEERTMEQILADGFVDLLHAGLNADPTIIPAAHRAAVKVIVQQDVLTKRAGYGILEDSLTPISWNTLEQWLCETGTLSVLLDPTGNPIDIGAEQRLFTRAQRAALAVRDAGCRIPGCTQPPSACEAHHIDHWHRDHGKTLLHNGILLCRYHHMLMHNGWDILRAHGTYWLKPPTTHDPHQTPTHMPTNNPLLPRTIMRQ